MLHFKLALGLLVVLVASLAAVAWDDPVAVPSAKKLESYHIPYRLSDVKHVVVRLKVNGKGPFNFVVDTGAPAVYFGNEMAKAIGLETKEAGYWKTIDKVDIEGGLQVNEVKVRVEEPFQLVGMNKINAAGLRYHGVLGYSVLAQFAIEYDFTKPHLKWTRLDWKPPPPVALGSLSEGATQNMKAMVGISSLATSLMPKKLDPTLVYRGTIGIETSDSKNGVVISKVLEKSPAAQASLQVNDKIISINEKDVATQAELQKINANIAAEQEVTLVVQRGDEKVTIKLKTIRGL